MIQSEKSIELQAELAKLKRKQAKMIAEHRRERSVMATSAYTMKRDIERVKNELDEELDRIMPADYKYLRDRYRALSQELKDLERDLRNFESSVE
jgi:hypothetical protein